MSEEITTPDPRISEENSQTVFDTPQSQQTRIALLEAEIVRLRKIESAAQEARAFLEGHRPGFAATYARDVLRAVLPAAVPKAQPLPLVKSRATVRRSRA